MKTTLSHLTPIALALILASCSNDDLSRSAAAAQLKTYFTENDTGTMFLPIVNEKNKILGDVWVSTCYFNGEERCPDNPVEPVLPCEYGACKTGLLINLKKMGLIRFEFAGKALPQNSFQIGHLYFKVHLTDEGKAYFVKEALDEEERPVIEVRTRELDAIEILAIGAPVDMGAKNVSTVRYVLKYRKTPFGEELLKKAASEETDEALFALYDNGWELEKEPLSISPWHDGQRWPHTDQRNWVARP
jgi:hypothetical protein